MQSIHHIIRFLWLKFKGQNSESINAKSTFYVRVNVGNEEIHINKILCLGMIVDLDVKGFEIFRAFLAFFSFFFNIRRNKKPLKLMALENTLT